MSYQALYRVWRPQRFDEVIGQPLITRTLKKMPLRQTKLVMPICLLVPGELGKLPWLRSLQGS